MGGAGDDRLRGEGGRNLSIGGTGRDIIEISGNDGDISIAGTTAFDTNRAALAAILAEWGSGRSYLERVLNLSGLGSPSRANGNTYLQLGSTIIDDGAVDNVLGSLLNADWQLLGIGDLLG